jgi:hypothetical protein
MLRIWQDKLKRRDAKRADIEAALADIAKSGEDLQQLSTSSARGSRLPVTQPAPVLAVTNTVLSPVMQESRPREAACILPERATPSRERRRSMIDPSQVKESLRLMNEPELITSPTDETLPGDPQPTLDGESQTARTLPFPSTNGTLLSLPSLSSSSSLRVWGCGWVGGRAPLFHPYPKAAL